MNWLGTIIKHVDYLSVRYQAYPVRDEHGRAPVGPARRTKTQQGLDALPALTPEEVE